jgi:tRNA A37 N6-isopentenylltransferase MiaA
VGKTEVAFGLAQQIGAEVVTADKFYLYNALSTVTGKSDACEYPTLRTHLYGALSLDDDRWSETRYRGELRSCVEGIQARRSPTIIEGCSNALVRTAIDTLTSSAQCPNEQPLLIGLRWKSNTNLAADCERRAAAMLSDGMVEEYRRALADGWRERYVVRKCFARTPLNQHLARTITLKQCRVRIAEELERHARRHYSQLTRIPNVIWIEHDRRSRPETIQKIIAIQKSASTNGDVFDQSKKGETAASQ